jgi:hypothetical protein
MMEEYFSLLYGDELSDERKLLEGDFEKAGQFGFFSQKFYEKNAILFDSIFPEIDKFVREEKAKRDVSALWKSELEQDRIFQENAIRNAQKIGVTNPIAEHKLEGIKKSLIEAEPETVMDSLARNAASVWSWIFENKACFDVCRQYLLHFEVASLLYKKYKADLRVAQRFTVPSENELKKIYLENGIDLSKVDQQFSKYDLLTIGEDFSFSASNLRVHDSRFDIDILIREIPRPMFQLLRELKNSGHIDVLSLRPDYKVVGKFLDLTLALEEFERGEAFRFEGLSMPAVAKLYSTDDYSNLWVHIDGPDITFEELLYDFEVYGDFVMTQVVHLQYFEENDEYLVSHIDHEFIFYTLDEYDKRKSNHLQKGEGRSRFKTFKVDNSRIPFVLPNGHFFLYEVLSQYFVKDDLLKEYFVSVV